MGKEHDEHVVTVALKRAIPLRCPEAGLLHHSNRGDQYTNEGYQSILNSMKLFQEFTWTLIGLSP
jgi:hypothetical protein